MVIEGNIEQELTLHMNKSSRFATRLTKHEGIVTY